GRSRREPASSRTAGGKLISEKKGSSLIVGPRTGSSSRGIAAVISLIALCSFGIAILPGQNSPPDAASAPKAGAPRPAAKSVTQAVAGDRFKSTVQPFLAGKCYTCHSG